MNATLTVVAGVLPEAQLEADGFVRAAAAVGIEAHLVNGTDAGEQVHQATHTVVVAVTDALVDRARTQAGMLRTIVRTAGLESLRVFRPWSTKVNRRVERVLMRSRLEIAELGDRPFALLPSAVGLALETSGRPLDAASPAGTENDVIVLVPDDDSSRFAWLDAAIAAAARAGTPRVMATTRDDSGDLLDIAEPLDVRRMRGARVVAPIHDVIALAEIVGARVHVLELRDESDMSTAWIRAHRPAHTIDELARRLEDVPRPPTVLQALCQFRAFDGSLEEFGEMLVASVLAAP